MERENAERAAEGEPWQPEPAERQVERGLPCLFWPCQMAARDSGLLWTLAASVSLKGPV
jgi:hypothetical protein